MVFRHAGLAERAGEPIEGFSLFPVIDWLPDELLEHMLFFAVRP